MKLNFFVRKRTKLGIRVKIKEQTFVVCTLSFAESLETESGEDFGKEERGGFRVYRLFL